MKRLIKVIGEYNREFDHYVSIGNLTSAAEIATLIEEAIRAYRTSIVEPNPLTKH